MASDNNSFKRQDDIPEQKRPSFEERKKDLTQFSDVKQVKLKEQNVVWKWVKSMFFSGRTPKDILLDVMENQIAPQMRDNFRNSLVSIIDLSIYKDHSTTASSETPGSFVTNYVSFSDQAAKQKQQLEENKKKEESVIKSGYETPAFATKRSAEQFLAEMHSYVNKYPTMTVFDLAWMQKKSVDFTWDKYGWEKAEILAVREPTHLSNPQLPWAIILPKAHLLE